jgi:2,5-diketo-D-gluconate reductase A
MHDHIQPLSNYGRQRDAATGPGVWKAGNEEVVTAIHKALEVGYRSIDTAAAYKNEDGVGTAIRDAGVAA